MQDPAHVAPVLDPGTSAGQPEPSATAPRGPANSGEPSRRKPAIPDHELLRRIGAGSYGEIWLARTVMGSFRGVKIVYRASFDHDRPFEREFEGLKRFEPISHARDTQVDIFHVGRNDAAGFFYYVMELADSAAPQVESVGAQQESGVQAAHESFRASCLNPQEYVPRTLKYDLHARGALPVTDCVQIALGLSQALEHLHEHGLVHRDVKPSNIIFVGGKPKLADIGLVSSIDATRSLVGTDGYIAPEGPGTPEADLYSLGKVLYECATGKDRLEFPRLPEEWRSHAEFNVLLELNEVVIKACEFDPARRYQAAKEMSADLASLRDGQSIRRNRALGKRRKVLNRAAAVVLTAILLGVATILLMPAANKHRPLSSNEQAQRLYDQSVYIANAWTFEEMSQACTNLLKAVALDPKFVDAYYLLWEASSANDWADRMPPRYDQRRNAEWVVDKLRKLRPNSAQYHIVMSDLAALDWDLEKAVSEARLACDLDPGFQRAHTVYGWWTLQFHGDVAAARKEFQKAERLDFKDVLTQDMLCRTYQFERNMPMAIAKYRELERLERRMNTHYYLRWAYEAVGQYDKALQEGEASELAERGASMEITNKYRRARLALDSKGPSAMWQSLLDDMKGSSPDDRYEMARLCTRLGDTNQVFVLLEKGRQEHDGDMVKLLFDDCWDGLRDDPRFDRELELMHLAKIKPPKK
jgi:serine/threonine protein kinase